MARQAHEVTETSRRLVKSMVALGCRHEDVATMLEVTPKTLRKHYRVELDRGAIEANAKVMQSLFTMATSGKHAAATIFWAKTRCGLREGGRERDKREETSSSIVVRVDES
jgi:hypothetical protein